MGGSTEGNNGAAILYKFTPSGQLMEPVRQFNPGTRAALHDIIMSGKGKGAGAGIVVDGNSDYRWLQAEFTCVDDSC